MKELALLPVQAQDEPRKGGRCPSGFLFCSAQRGPGPAGGLGVPIAPKKAGGALGSSSLSLSRWQ